jgi:hypothetical protein
LNELLFKGQPTVLRLGNNDPRRDVDVPQGAQFVFDIDKDLVSQSDLELSSCGAQASSRGYQHHQLHYYLGTSQSMILSAPTLHQSEELLLEKLLHRNHDFYG